MFTNILQRTCQILSSYGQRTVSSIHPFDRSVLKCRVRCHFPKPREVKRIKVHGWDARMATDGGRRVLMRRILKGRYVLSH